MPSPPSEARRAFRAPLIQVLGVSLGMPEARVHHVLGLIGRRPEVSGERESEDGGEGLERELWMLDDRRYASILVVFDAEHRVHAFQAYLRPGGRGLKYREIGDLSQARRMGYTIWQWDVLGQPGRPGRRVVARGTDSVYAGSIAVTKLDAEEGPTTAEF